MRTIIIALALFASFQVVAQQFNTPFSTVAELSRDEAFRDRVGVAMYIRAGEALSNQVPREANYDFYEKKFAALIVTEADNRYNISIFTNAVLTTGANKETPDAFLYASVNALWPQVVEAWMLRNGYIKLTNE